MAGLEGRRRCVRLDQTSHAGIEELAKSFGKNLGPVSHSQKIMFVTLEHRGA